MSDRGACPVRLHGGDFRTDPGGLYQRMRAEHGPVVPVLLEGDVPAWLVIGYRELHHVLSSPDVFARASHRWNAWDRVPEDWPLLPMVLRLPTVLYSEGEEHRRRAGALSDALAGTDLHELRTVTTRMADRLIDAFCSSTGTDLRLAYTARLPALVLSWLYGLDDERGDEAASLMTTMIDGGAEAMDAQRALMAAMADIVAQRRADPGGDVVSRLLAHPAGYTDEEAVPELIVLLGGGNQPTGEWLGNALRLMLTDDRFAASIAGARRSAQEALNEVLWEDTPTQVHAGRYAAHDVELGGRLLRRGDLVLLGLAGANTDPDVHSGTGAPGDRGNHAHLSFSHGEHRCPYPAQEIAEIIAVTGIEVLMDRLPDLELMVAAEELRWRPSPWVRGVASLPVAFTPVPPLGEN
ncbi:cytochrome [Nocardiopsis sp. TSRI0078]|uniref:cytochrome P450 n=1 Tax=unclassified Nocardiopsis TaxID=2649073 RepID=UPI00093E703B|nr:cytochrome P450 [Nocardiopsis sp. TSRI0078]OKI17122.1 cytochrome [Nocardiopsis sp. TSRI0078]